jgi:hypothetical protein
MKKGILWIIAATLIAVLMISGSVFAEGEEPATIPIVEPTSEIVEDPSSAVSTEPGIEPVSEPDAEITTEGEIQPELPAEELAIGNDSLVGEELIPSSVEETAANTEPILTNANGEALDLASQESAELIASGDPYWYVGLVKYQTVFNIADCPAGTAGVTCWASALTPINEALARIEGGLLPTDRKLYIVGGTPFTENISIDGSSVFDFRKSQLTGFIGMPDLLGVYPVLNGFIDLEMMKYGFTLSDITINNGYFSIKESKGVVLVKNVKVKNAAGSGIIIGDETGGVYTQHLGNVTLNNVISNGNSGSGAEIYSTGTTTILNSAFNFNGADGLTMRVLTGKTTLKGITAIGNQDSNVMILRYQNALVITDAVFNDAQNGSGLYAVSTNSGTATINSVIANTNDAYGIYLRTNGSVTLTNIEASGNLNASGVFIYHPLGSSLVQIKTSQFMNNGLASSGSGLEIYTKGPVSINSINAGGNDGDGLYLDNCLEAFGACTGIGNVTITSPAGARWMDANNFINNGGDGVELHSFGIVTLSNFKSDDNSGYGLNIDNHKSTNSIFVNTTLTDWFNTANNNSGIGIYLWSRGLITVDNTNASDNGSNGFFAGTTPLTIKITDGEFNNNSSGLYIISSNPITINNVDANDNTVYGIYITVNAAKTISVVKSNALNNQNGIFISNLGNVLFSTVSANNNTGYGAKIEGCLAGTCLLKSNFSMYGTNTFNGNGGIGLDVNAFGAISISGVSAQGNSSQGLLLDNVFTGLINGVSITNTSINQIKGNTIGVEIYTNGAITLTSVNSSSNTSYGAYLDNSSAAAARSLTLTKCTFEDNGNTGIYANIHGPIYGYSLRASYNTGSGAYFNNTNGDIFLSPTSGMSRFIDNTGQGLDIDSTGNVVLKNIIAELNGANGVYVDCAGSVKVSGDNTARATSFSENVLDGLHILSDGNITIASFVYANWNTSDGMYLNNQTAASPKIINVYYSETNNNSGQGLWILGSGAINLVSVESQFNGGDGVNAASNSALSGVVSVSGINLLSNNGDDGLELHTPLNVKVSGVTANYNAWSGIYLTSASGLTTLSNTSTHMNTHNGIEINAANKVTITSAKSFNNGDTVTYGDGLWIASNNFDVLIKSSTFIGNFGNGIDAQPGTGVVTLSSTVYIGNDADNTGLIDDLYVH